MQHGVPTPLAHEAAAIANRNEMPQAMKTPLAILVEAVVNALGVRLLVTPATALVSRNLRKVCAHTSASCNPVS